MEWKWDLSSPITIGDYDAYAGSTMTTTSTDTAAYQQKAFIDSLTYMPWDMKGDPLLRVDVNRGDEYHRTKYLKISSDLVGASPDIVERWVMEELKNMLEKDFIAYMKGEDPMDKTFKYLPHPKHVQENISPKGDYVTVIWQDGTSTVVKRKEDEDYDFEKAIMYAIFKKCFNNYNASMKKYFKEFEDKTVEVKKKK